MPGVQITPGHDEATTEIVEVDPYSRRPGYRREMILMMYSAVSHTGLPGTVLFFWILFARTADIAAERSDCSLSSNLAGADEGSTWSPANAVPRLLNSTANSNLLTLDNTTKSP